MSSYYSEKHYRPRHHGPPPLGTVVRWAKFQKPHRSPPTAAAAPLPAGNAPMEAPEEAPKEEPMEKAVSPPGPQWSTWDAIKYPQWDGYWRAKARKDGGWTYEFTKDFITIWEHKPAEITPPAQLPSSSGASATTTSEPALFAEEIVAPATTSSASPQALPLEQPPATSAVNGGCNCTFCQDTALQALSCDVSALRTESRDTEERSMAGEQRTVTSSQAAVPSAADVARSTKKGSHSQLSGGRKGSHHHSHHSKKTARHPGKIREVVRADKNKKQDARAAVDHWVWEWGYGA